MLAADAGNIDDDMMAAMAAAPSNFLIMLLSTSVSKQIGAIAAICEDSFSP